MYLPKYSAANDANHETYEFLSSGPKGRIKKIVKYTEIQSGIFNLGFGDWDEIKQTVTDNTRTNNKDRDIVLATVASTVIDFMKHHPGAILFARGETPAKTRLYQMGLNANWNSIGHLFEVFGFAGAAWQPFELNKNYEAFSIKAKQIV